MGTPMGFLVLSVWLSTAILGGHLFTVWLRHGGLQQRRAGVTRLPLWLVLGHVALAATGLLAWIAFLLGHAWAMGWAAWAVVLVVASLGFAMLLRWLPTSGRHAHGDATAERHFPVTAVVAHGLCATATVLLALLTVLRAA